jgi:hypothetical protein
MILVQLLIIIIIYILYLFFDDWKKAKMKGVEIGLRNINIF